MEQFWRTLPISPGLGNPAALFPARAAAVDRLAHLLGQAVRRGVQADVERWGLCRKGRVAPIGRAVI